MTIDEYGTLYRGLLEAKVYLLVDEKLCPEEWQRKRASDTLGFVMAAMEVFSKSIHTALESDADESLSIASAIVSEAVAATEAR